MHTCHSVAAYLPISSKNLTLLNCLVGYMPPSDVIVRKAYQWQLPGIAYKLQTHCEDDEWVKDCWTDSSEEQILRYSTLHETDTPGRDGFRPE